MSPHTPKPEALNVRSFSRVFSADARHQVAMQLLHSEWEYVSTLNQLLDKYKTAAAQQGAPEPQ